MVYWLLELRFWKLRMDLESFAYWVAMMVGFSLFVPVNLYSHKPLIEDDNGDRNIWDPDHCQAAPWEMLDQGDQPMI